MKMKNMESPQNFAAGEVYVDSETEELAESGMEMKNSDSEEEREEKMEMGRSENEGIDEKSKSVVMVGGYNRDMPPEDDCCPICFDAFHFPCRTSCGHWFCSRCILQHWRYSANFKPCKCPICSCLITKLVPESSILIQPGEEVGKILKNIQRYNRLTIGGWPGLYLKAQALPLLIRRRLREYLNPMILRCIYNATRLIGLLLGILYDFYDFHFFPNGGLGIRLLFEICGCAMVIFVVLDAIWHRWMLRRRARHLAELAGLQQME
ncbi:hypothetical protein Pfo_019165 [Paulownia fortunei]|nr:hypothetical protein Pfo_019165 [Paulownia fortunei]